MADTVAAAFLASTFGQRWELQRSEYMGGAFMWRLVTPDGRMVDSCPSVHNAGEECPHYVLLSELHDSHAVALDQLTTTAA